MTRSLEAEAGEVGEGLWDVVGTLAVTGQIEELFHWGGLPFYWVLSAVGGLGGQELKQED